MKKIPDYSTFAATFYIMMIELCLAYPGEIEVLELNNIDEMLQQHYAEQYLL